LKQFLKKLDQAHDGAYFTLTDGDTPDAAPVLPPPRGAPSIEMFIAMLVGIGFGAGAIYLLGRFRSRLPSWRRDTGMSGS
jgi:hypothetical protein